MLTLIYMKCVQQDKHHTHTHTPHHQYTLVLLGKLLLVLPMLICDSELWRSCGTGKIKQSRQNQECSEASVVV